MTRKLPSPRRAALALLPVLALSLPACERGPSDEPSEAAIGRTLAARRSCVAAEIHRRAASDVRDLEETVARSGDGPGAELTRRAGVAALEFARAYEQHAQLRTAAYAHMDSALRFSRRSADSVRHAELARRVSIRSPEAGTLEANVLQAYERDLNALARDPDHPCNWEMETG